MVCCDTTTVDFTWHGLWLCTKLTMCCILTQTHSGSLGLSIFHRSMSHNGVINCSGVHCIESETTVWSLMQISFSLFLNQSHETANNADNARHWNQHHKPVLSQSPAERLIQPPPFASSSPHPLISLTPQGSHRTPYLTLNLGHPCISVYLLLTVKKPHK